METKAFVLLSGGIDSTTALAIAFHQYAQCEGVSIDYGQRHKREIEYAQAQCQEFDIPHTVIKLTPEVLDRSMLTDATQEIPDIKYSEIQGVSPTYVPFRNGTMLSLITAHAQKWTNEGDDRNAAVYFGAHAEDAANWAYPDCTPEFIGAMANAIFIGTYRKVRLVTPLMWMTKAEVVKVGDTLNVSFDSTWSCYAGGEVHCGRCPTCYARQLAFKEAGVVDPTQYATAR